MEQKWAISVSELSRIVGICGHQRLLEYFSTRTKADLEGYPIRAITPVLLGC